MPSVRYHPNDNENTMATGVGSTCWRSRMKLARRYGHIDVEAAINEICYYLKRNFPANNNPYNKYLVAARAMYPDYGAIGLNRHHDYQTVALYWAAANDLSITTATDLERLNAFVKALVECQRNPDRVARNSNAPIAIDAIICSTGIFDKFAEMFSMLHPDISSGDMHFKVLELTRGFIAELLYAHGSDYAALVSDDFSIELEAPLREAIKTKVKLIVQHADEYSSNVQNYIDGVFAELSFLTFVKYERNHERINYTRAGIDDLIAYANAAYNVAMTTDASSGVAPLELFPPLSEEYIRRIRSNVRQIIPLQNNAYYLTLTGGRFFMDGHTTQEPAFLPLWTPRTFISYVPPTILTQQEVNAQVEARLERRGI